MSKRARTSIPVHELIAERWSPRSFDEAAVLERDHVVALLEAARWAPSANNLQPWRFAVTLRDSAQFNAVLATLMPGNRMWAHRASALVLAAADSTTPSGTANRWATYDVGTAVSLLTVQAHAMSLHVHQVGGFDRAAVSALFHLPDSVEPLVVLAIGTVGEAELLAEGPQRDREVSTRDRKPLEELVLTAL
jgi:nitroreductase